MPVILLNLMLIFGVSVPANCAQCLPTEIKCDDVVSAHVLYSNSNGSAIKTITVAQMLRQLHAHCRRGKLVDGKGKEIHFYRLSGCWGNPPDNAQEILDQQEKELEKLRPRYRVITLTCNPSGNRIL
jgi:predicted transcriptional regulator